MTYNTNNPLGSTDPRDLLDNAESYDRGMNSNADTFKGRFGQNLYTWAFFNRLAASGLAQVNVIVGTVNTAAAAAIQQMQETAASIGEDIGNKGFSTYAEMQAYVPIYDGQLAWVQADTDAGKNGFYQWNAATSAWVRPSTQPALSTDIDAVNKSITPRKRPLGPVTGQAPMIWGIGNMLVTLPVQKKRPLGPDLRQGPFLTMGDSVMLSMEARKRPLTEAFTESVILLSGESVMLRSGGSTPVSPIASADQKTVQEQNEKPAGKRQASVVDGQVWAFEPSGAAQLTQAGTWLSAQVVAFDMVRALKSSGSAAQPHSITKDGRIFRDGNVLLHKLATGQSLALGSRGIVLDASGEYTIDGRRGNLFSPFTPVGYAENLFTLPGGPRPTSWVGASALEPVREFVAGVVGETPATSYMLALRRWHERTTSISPKLLYSVSAVGGSAYAGIKKGTATYTNALAHVTAAKNIASSNGWDYQVPSLSIVHGESQINTTQAEYVAMLSQWIGDYRTDISAITGQAIPPVAFISQMLTGEAGTIPGIPLAQMQSHNENPNIIMVGPKYAYGYFDQFHMTADGYIKMGELEARAERLSQVSGKWQPLKVISAVRSGVTLTLKLNNLPNGNAGTPGPIGRVVVDATTIVDPGNAGFQLSAGTIASVVAGADGASIVITTTADIAAGVTLSYALQPALNTPQSGSGRRGCVRDTDLRDYSRYDNKPLYNWLCAFSMELQ